MFAEPLSGSNTPLCHLKDDTIGSKYADKAAAEACASAEKAQAVVVGGEVKERACDSLVMCIVTTLNQGLRNGGGIGDILRAPSSSVSFFLNNK